VLALMLSALLLSAVSALIHVYFWKRLVRDTLPAGRVRRIGGVTLAALAALVLLVLFPVHDSWLHDWLWLLLPGYVWLAVTIYLFLALVALEPLRLALSQRHRLHQPTADRAGTASGRPTSSLPSELRDPSRRLLLSRGVAVVATAAAAGLVGHGARSALGPPRIDRLHVPIHRLPRRMDGFRLAVVADIHLNPLAGRAHTERIVATINRLNPDLVALVGDLTEGTVERFGPAAAPLRNIVSRHGTFFVTGNHEYYVGVEQWLAELHDLGLHLMQNRRVEIDGLDLAGVNDPIATDLGYPGPDYHAALGDRDPYRPVVLMAHQPVQAREIAGYGVDLQVSGHTHGGQLAPFGLLTRLAQPVVNGLGEVDGTRVYVTNGAGFWGPPVRVGAPPEVGLLELRAS
jgi:predicted MPP superfamily phosphohydrolase